MELCPWSSLVVFLAIAAPWHVLAGLANPTQGQPTPFHFVHWHWQVPLPTDGNVRGWFWFYFMNEHVLRYLNLRVPHDYDTVPLVAVLGIVFCVDDAVVCVRVQGGGVGATGASGEVAESVPAA